MLVFGYGSDANPQEDERAFIDFNIGSMEVHNGKLIDARMQIQAGSIAYDELYPNFTVAKANGPWTEDAITWQNQPGSGDGFLVTDDDAIGSFIVIADDTLRRGIFSFDFFNFASSWINGDTDYGIVLKTHDGSIEFSSSEMQRIGVVSPAVGLKFVNTEQLPANRVLNIGYVESGDILRFHYRDMRSRLRTKPFMSNQTYEPAKQWLGFSSDDSPCIGSEWMEMGVFMDEDLTRTPYLMIEVKPGTSAINPRDAVGFTSMLAFDNGMMVPFGEDQEFTVEITENSEYGSLLAPGVSDRTDRLEEVENNWIFIATDTFDADSVVATVWVNTIFSLGSHGVPTAGDEQPMPALAQTASSQHAFADSESPFPRFGPFFSTPVSGKGQITIHRQQSLDVSLHIREPKQIWPTLPTAYGGNPDEKNVLKNITVKVMKDGEPAPNKEIKISVTIILPSGGHNHTNQPDKLGIIKDLRTGNPNNGYVISKTNSEGEIHLEYTSNQFGGLVKFSAAIASDSDIADVDTVVVRVPELVKMPQRPFYELTGKTNSHQKNHWLLLAARDSLIKNARIFFNAPWNNNNEKMRINDLSLPAGGLFDINPNWQPPHLSHRTGKDVDIENLDRIHKLIYIMDKKGWWNFINEGQLSGASNKYPHFRYID